MSSLILYLAFGAKDAKGETPSSQNRAWQDLDMTVLTGIQSSTLR